VNIEQLTKSNFSSSIRMIVEFERAIDSNAEAIAEQANEIKMGNDPVLTGNKSGHILKF